MNYGVHNNYIAYYMHASKPMTVFQWSAFSWAINIPSMNTCLIAEFDSNHNYYGFSVIRCMLARCAFTMS